MSNGGHEVIVQAWTKSARGSWSRRGDGYSLHLTDADRKAYIDDEFINKNLDRVLDHKESLPGASYRTKVGIATFANVRASKNGIRGFGCPPGSDGTDNWISASPEKKKEEEKGVISFDELQWEIELTLVLLKDRSPRSGAWRKVLDEHLQNLHKLISQALGK